MAENPISSVGGFAKRHIFAFILLLVVAMIVAVALEYRKAGRLSGKIAKIPLIGRRILGMKSAAEMAATPSGPA